MNQSTRGSHSDNEVVANGNYHCDVITSRRNYSFVVIAFSLFAQHSFLLLWLVWRQKINDSTRSKIFINFALQDFFFITLKSQT